MNSSDLKHAQQVKSANGSAAAPAPSANSNQNVFRSATNAIAGAGASLGQMTGTVAAQVSNATADRTVADIILQTGQKINAMLSGQMEPLPLTAQAMDLFLSGFTQVSEQLTILEATDPKQLGGSEPPSLPCSLESASPNGNGTPKS